MERQIKHIMVTIQYRGKNHWRLIPAKKEGKHYQISIAAYDQFLKDVRVYPYTTVTVG